MPHVQCSFSASGEFYHPPGISRGRSHVRLRFIHKGPYYMSFCNCHQDSWANHWCCIVNYWQDENGQPPAEGQRYLANSYGMPYLRYGSSSVRYGVKVSAEYPCYEVSIHHSGVFEIVNAWIPGGYQVPVRSGYWEGEAMGNSLPSDKVMIAQGKYTKKSGGIVGQNEGIVANCYYDQDLARQRDHERYRNSDPNMHVCMSEEHEWGTPEYEAWLDMDRLWEDSEEYPWDCENPRNTEAMKNSGTYGGFGFASVNAIDPPDEFPWRIRSGVNGGYPYLHGMFEEEEEELGEASVSATSRVTGAFGALLRERSMTTPQGGVLRGRTKLDAMLTRIKAHILVGSYDTRIESSSRLATGTGYVTGQGHFLGTWGVSGGAVQLITSEGYVLSAAQLLKLQAYITGSGSLSQQEAVVLGIGDLVGLESQVREQAMVSTFFEPVYCTGQVFHQQAGLQEKTGAGVEIAQVAEKGVAQNLQQRVTEKGVATNLLSHITEKGAVLNTIAQPVRGKSGLRDDLGSVRERSRLEALWMPVRGVSRVEDFLTGLRSGVNLAYQHSGIQVVSSLAGVFCEPCRTMSIVLDYGLSPIASKSTHISPTDVLKSVSHLAGFILVIGGPGHLQGDLIPSKSLVYAGGSVVRSNSAVLVVVLPDGSVYAKVDGMWVPVETCYAKINGVWQVQIVRSG